VNSIVGPIFNEILIEKEICGSCEQCTGPTSKTLDAQTLDVCAIQTFTKSSRRCLEILHRF